MSVEAVREYLRRWNRQEDILLMDVSTATVPLAAQALGVEEARIAKTLSFAAKEDDGHALILVTAGDQKIDNRKFKDQFGMKARMLSPEDALRLTGHPVGGVCPFALPAGTEVYLDRSLERFTTVYPACGAGNSAIEMTPAELERCAEAAGWVDVCKAIA